MKKLEKQRDKMNGLLMAASLEREGLLAAMAAQQQDSLNRRAEIGAAEAGYIHASNTDRYTYTYTCTNIHGSGRQTE